MLDRNKQLHEMADEGRQLMTDYIKREDAIKAFDPLQRQDWYTPWIVETLKDLPPADVEPVVRCKDCKFGELFQNDSSGVMARYCKAFTFEPMVADNDFCSYGERRGDEIDRRGCAD